MFGIAAPKYQDHTQHPHAVLLAMESEAFEITRAKSLHHPSVLGLGRNYKIEWRLTTARAVLRQADAQENLEGTQAQRR